MTLRIEDILARFNSIEPIETTTPLARCVWLKALTASLPPDFLFTSGKPNRYNPAGVCCIYLAENVDTAILELTRGAVSEPYVVFRGEPKLPALDLTDPATIAAVGFSQEDLIEEWFGETTPTKTQQLGLAVSQQSKFAAIRYHSVATSPNGVAGTNLVVFKDSVVAPAELRILTGDQNLIQVWPIPPRRRGRALTML